MLDYDYLWEEYGKCFQDKSRVYMITHYLSTFDATRSKMVRFQLFPRQQDLCTQLGNATNVVTTKPRQAGITTTCGAFIACEMCLADPRSPQVVLAIGNTLDLAQQMLFKIRDFLLQLPLWMWGEAFADQGYDMTKPPEDVNVIFARANDKYLELRNGCKVYARSSGPNASRGVGGVKWLIFDEAAFIENGNDVYASAVPTVSTGGHIIMISTPNGKDGLYYETCRQARLKGTDDWNNFELVDMKWYQDPRYNKFLEWTKRDEETGEVEIYKEKTFSTYDEDEDGTVTEIKGNVEYQPDHWDEMIRNGWKPRSVWYVTMCQQFNNDEQKIAQELDVSFLGSASNVVAPEFIDMQEKLNMREPMKKGEDGDPFNIDETWVWKPPIPGHKYIMSIDCSRGDAADRTAIEILDLTALDDDGKPCIEQVFEYHGKKTGDDIGEMGYVYGTLYGNAYTTIDCIGGTGDACILTMMRLGYKNLYYDDPQLNKYTMEREVSSLKPTKDGKLPGFHSNAVRFQMLTFFANMVKTNQIKIRSARVIDELGTWIYKGDAGRIDHMDGKHDDTLTCLAMAVFVNQYHLGDIEKAKERDAAYLRAWASSSHLAQPVQRRTGEISADPRINHYQMPFYSTKTVYKSSGNPTIDALRWLIQ